MTSRKGKKTVPRTGGLTYAQNERLLVLADEVTKLSGMLLRTLRHGYEYIHPERASKGITNRRELEVRLGRVTALVTHMCNKDDVDDGAIAAAESDFDGRLRAMFTYVDEEVDDGRQD